MKYKSKGCCECCGQFSFVRADKMQGIVCKNCNEPIMRFKPKKNYDRHRSHSYDDVAEFGSRHKKAV